MKELTFPHISCCTPESKPYSLPGQQSKADLVDGGAGELALSVWEWESSPHPSHLLWGDEGEEKIPPLTLPLVVKKLADTAPLPASAFRWLDPALCLGCTAELSYLQGVGKLAQECELGRSVPTPLLSYDCMDKRCPSPTPHLLWPVGELVLRS